MLGESDESPPVVGFAAAANRRSGSARVPSRRLLSAREGAAPARRLAQALVGSTLRRVEPMRRLRLRERAVSRRARRYGRTVAVPSKYARYLGHDQSASSRPMRRPTSLSSGMW